MRRPPDAAAAPEGATDQANAPEGNQQSNPASDYIASFIGQQIPGGCDHCDAYQTVQTARDQWASLLDDDTPDGYLDGCFIATVYHDDDCPWWLRNQNRAARRNAVRQAKRRRAS
jgi:hypothetical protein